MSSLKRYLGHKNLITDPELLGQKDAYLFCDGKKLCMLPLVLAVIERAEYRALFRR